jgi:hypothetical protein
MTNKDLILARMFGYPSHIQMGQCQMKPAVMEIFDRYNKRYHYERLIQDLTLNWKVLFYSNKTHGIFISTKMDIQQLALAAERKKRKKELERLKKQKEEAREQALQLLNKEHQLNKELDF